MGVIEVRRHAERAGPTHSGSALSPAGRAMAEALGRRAPAYALVVASPLPRARETAALIGGRVDRTEPELLPDLSQIVQASTIEEYASLLAEGGRERDIAHTQAAAWSRIAAQAGDRAALVITHGGVIELGGLAVAAGLARSLRGPAFSYCEGLRLTFDRGRATAIEPLRV